MGCKAERRESMLEIERLRMDKVWCAVFDRMRLRGRDGNVEVEADGMMEFYRDKAEATDAFAWSVVNKADQGGCGLGNLAREWHL